MEVPGRRKEIGSDVAGSVYEGAGGGPIACIAARLKAVWLFENSYNFFNHFRLQGTVQ